MRVSILFLLVLVPLIFGIPILVAVYVYRDANKRGMNAVLWTLIALFTPSLLGLIIYLLVRNNYSDLTCPNCNAPVEESYVVCPTCRTKLRPTCDVCSSPVQTTWKVCPHCGNELPQYSMDVATPVRKKDNTLGKILIAILVIPIAILVLLIVLALPFSYTKSGFSTSSVHTLTMSEFMEDRTEKEVLLYNELFNGFTPTNEQPYQIFIYEADRQDDIYEYQYLIYIPGAGEMQDISYHTTQKGFFKKQEYLVLDILCDPTDDEQVLFIYNYEGSAEPADMFLINYNGEEHEIRPEGHIGTPFLPTDKLYPAASSY